MAAGARGSIIGQRTDQRIEQFDHHDRCLSRRSIRLPLALILAAVVLTACAWDPPTIERTPRDAVGPETSAKSRLAARKNGTQTGAAPAGATGEKIDVPGDMAALEVDLTNFKERLIGLDSDEINDIMGTPGLERAEPPALIWQYRHQICTVDIFMFDDGGGATVDHVDVRPTAGGNVNEKECFTALLRNVPQSGGANSGVPGAQLGLPPISPSPSMSVGRRAAPSAAPPSGPAQTPSSSRPPVPSTAGPSAAPVMPAAPAAAAIPEGEEGPPPTDTDVDFDFGPPPAASVAPPRAPMPDQQTSGAQSRLPSAAPSSEAIPTLPPEFSDVIAPSASSGAKPASPPAANPLARPSPNSSDIEIPSSANIGGADEFADPTDNAPPPTVTAAPPPAIAKPAPEKPLAAAPSPQPVAKPAPAPLAAVPPPSAPPSIVAPAVVAPSVPPPAVPSAVVVPPPSAAPSPALPTAVPAPLAPRGATATAQALPKGAAKGAAKSAARAIEEIDDEDLPPDLLGRRDDDPSRNNEDMVE